MKLKAFVYRKSEAAILPQKATAGSIGYDLCAAEDTTVLPMQSTRINTGLVIKTPEGYGAFIFPRSSLFNKKGLILSNSVGVIDHDYCGENDEIKISVINLKSEPVTVLKGEKIAQLVFLKTGSPDIVEVDTPPRGNSRGGFGSTEGYR